MSDLCYNCGDCHLPRPCPQPLKLCDICQNWGHAYNFCPLSVRQREPNYQFWALCHNCDKWHLPDACEAPLHGCVQCGHSGHREYFCPVNPLTRLATFELSATKVNGKGNKRQKTNDSNASEAANMHEINKQSDEHIRQAKAFTAREVLNLRDNGYSNIDIMQYITRQPLGMSHDGTAPAFSPASTDFKTPDPEANAHHDLATITQTPATPSRGVHHPHYERFSGSEPAHNKGAAYQSPYATDPTSHTQMPNTVVSFKKDTSVPAGVLQQEPLRPSVAAGVAPSPHFQFDEMVYRNVDWPSGANSTTTVPASSMTDPSMNMPTAQEASASVPTSQSTTTQGLARSSLKHLLNGPTESEAQDAPQPAPVTTGPSSFNGMENNNVTLQRDSVHTNEVHPTEVQASSYQTQEVTAVPGMKDYVMVPGASNESAQDATQQPAQEGQIEEKPKKTRGRPAKRKT